MLSKSWLQTFFAKLKKRFPRTHLLLKYSRPEFLGHNSPLVVMKRLFHRIANGVIAERAASVSFNFILALFPAVIFVFTLIPYTPVAELQEQIFSFLGDVLPPGSYELVEGVIKQIIEVKRGGLLWSTLLVTWFLVVNGTMSLMANFAVTAEKEFINKFYKRYLSAALITILFFVIILTAILLMVVGELVLNFLLEEGLPEVAGMLIHIVRLVVLLSMLLLLVSLLYKFGPLKLRLRELITPGSIFSTTGMWLSSMGFSWYVTNFSNFESLYGSIGTFPMIMLWIYLNAISLILGFEINTIIAELVHEREQVGTDTSTSLPK